ncbi:hypothetical protein OPV22_020515 [Ensete ventricosum]|uniref:Uncharacterized protein n=1 Tax=Ensete ventricosum TaxID=4639 RepID=A0AAV8QQ67_ENSVE|nr:hypothetical protein OPV22_020515 [Ensete ventricosum]
MLNQHEGGSQSDSTLPRIMVGLDVVLELGGDHLHESCHFAHLTGMWTQPLVSLEQDNESGNRSMLLWV